MVLGRADDASVRIDDPEVSWRHARVYRSGVAYLVEDLGSTNGTRVEDERIARPRRLGDGDRVRIGGAVLEVALQDAEEQAAVFQLYQSAIRDPLTGIHNRRYLDERLEGELAFAQRHGSRLSLLILDVDHFKRINDELGHPAGDAVLRALAQMLAEAVRTEDVLGRYGGEEFAIIVRGIDQAGAVLLAERIRSTVGTTRIPWHRRTISLTISVGVATHTPDRPYDDVPAFVGAADEALLRAKRTGRDRVCVATRGTRRRRP